MKPTFFKAIAALSLLVGMAQGKAVAQTTDMSLTGGANEGGTYSGYVYHTYINASFYSGASANIAIGAIWLQFALPPGTAFDQTAPSNINGWSFTYVDANNVYLENTASIPANSFQSFQIPFETTGPISNGQTGGQITIHSPFLTDSDPANDHFDGLITVGGVALPVQFSSFTVTDDNCKADLHWSTEVERNNAGFEVERSTDGEQFASIGEVKVASSNSLEHHDYSFVDAQPQNGHNFYRIRQIDLDGKSVTTTVEQIKFDCFFSGIDAYPNPSTGIVYVKGLKNQSTIEVYNVLGQLVLTKETQNNLEGINLTSLASGTYQISVIQNKTSVFSTKVVKQ